MLTLTLCAQFYMFGEKFRQTISNAIEMYIYIYICEMKTLNSKLCDDIFSQLYRKLFAFIYILYRWYKPILLLYSSYVTEPKSALLYQEIGLVTFIHRLVNLFNDIRNHHRIAWRGLEIRSNRRFYTQLIHIQVALVPILSFICRNITNPQHAK